MELSWQEGPNIDQALRNCYIYLAELARREGHGDCDLRPGKH